MINTDTFVLGMNEGVIGELEFYPLSILSDPDALTTAIIHHTRTVLTRAGTIGKVNPTPPFVKVHTDEGREPSKAVGIEVSVGVTVAWGAVVTLGNCPWCTSAVSGAPAYIAAHIRAHNPPPGATKSTKSVVVKGDTSKQPVSPGVVRVVVKPKQRKCTANSLRGTGTGTCDTPLDKHGNCPRAGAHIQ